MNKPLSIPTDEEPTEAPKSESREQRKYDEYIKILQNRADRLERERDAYRLLYNLLYNTLLKYITGEV